MRVNEIIASVAPDRANDAQPAGAVSGMLPSSPHPMNLATNYLGLKLQNPFVAGASPCCDDVDVALRLQDAGASAVVMRSLFEEQIETGIATAPPRDAGGIAPDDADYLVSPEEYLRQIEHLKRTLTIPVIASLNGHHPGSWTNFASQLERAGADAIELNFYQVVTDPAIAADQIEREMLEMTGHVCDAVKIPVAAKLSPYHSGLAQLAVALELVGAAGIVIFNRFYQPDVDTDDLEVQPLLRLSEPGELLLRLRWLAILSPLLRGSLSATGGIHTSAGVVKSLLTGAHTVQLVSVLLRHGPHVIASLREGLEAWMRQHDYTDIDQFRGMLNHQRCRDTAAYERANYIRVLQSWKV
jgi:dihydroorotate dehydrogenase (fumarate)